MLFYFNAEAQQGIASFYVPDTVCDYDTIVVTFGFDPTCNVMFRYDDATLGHDDTIFLPDGIPCGDMGCSYVSSVVFTEFEDTAKLRSVETIRFLRINIEHSYAADLYISLQCPTGQSSTIMRFGGTLNSDCYEEIPIDERWWLPEPLHGNINWGSFFGEALDDADPANLCDSSSPRNRPGTGWNYCWSNNSISNYSYASGDGLIYRAGHAHNGIIDSSNVAEHTNFYHPDQSFSSLLNCPLNGTWSVKVVDGYSQDNGYIFGWALSLDANMSGYTPCPVDSFAIIGPGAIRVDENTYYLVTPAGFDQDTTVEFIFRTFDICGEVYDTSAFITFRATQHSNHEQTVVENQLPVVFNGEEFYDSVTNYIIPLTIDGLGCDSLVHYTLNVWYNVHQRYDTTVCSSDLPIVWRGAQFSTADSIVFQYQTVHGADSIITLLLKAVPNDTNEVNVSVCKGVPYTWIDGITYYDDSERPVVNINTGDLCDSIIRLNITMNNDSYKALVMATPNPVPDVNEMVTLRDLSKSSSRQWFLEDRIDTARVCSFAFAYPKDSVEVLFTGRDISGCKDTTTLMIYSNIYVYWIPNVFTPDESTNRLFSVFSRHILSGTVYIYNRSGAYITDFDVLTGSWDGTKNGIPCPQGTYVWKLDYTTDFTPEVLQSAVGTVTILR
ncbi:MAG: gliding motility-associated C-terminal domain-containing protein [Bacteroidales bacterium]|nr:gliding motility-associated C-terminal domain-containing protein [Bacteroidales bacterium]